MKRTKRSLYKWTTAALAIALAVAISPALKAAEDGASTAPAQPEPATQPQPSSASSAPTSQPSSETADRLAQLEKEVDALQSEIAAMKDAETPSVKAAAYVLPDAQAGGAAAAPAAAAPEKISISSLLGPVTLSGFGDVYYGYDYNHPPDNLSGLRFFEAPTNGFAFNMAELILDKPADATSADSRLGYHVSAGYGQAARVVNGSDTFSDGSNFYLKEAYLDYLAPIGKGLTITVGKFVTPAGAEVIESNANWNYSRSLLFYYAIPYFHFGANAKYTFNPKFALTGYLVNGWNNTIIDHYAGVGTSSGLTYGVSLAYTPNAKWSATENYIAGPVVDAYTGAGFNVPATEWRQLSDTVIGYTPNAKWAFQLNGDYGWGPRYYALNGVGAVTGQSPAVNWGGIAGYAKYTWSPKTNFAVRYEYFNDTNGYTGLLTGAFAGDPGHAQEVTATYSYNLTSALLVRGEYRYDFASEPIFPQSTSDFVKEQNTAYLSFVYSFSSANLK
jgi:Putative beta-barrel porin-2, OmpL-like. bbp2